MSGVTSADRDERHQLGRAVLIQDRQGHLLGRNEGGTAGTPDVRVLVPRHTDETKDCIR